MIPGITEVNFPSYATLHQATISFEEMGERVITTQVKIDGDVVPDFESEEWALVYNGEKFVLNTHTPQATKDNTSRNSLLDLTFTSFPISELKRYFFIELSEVETGTVIIDKYIASLRLNARNFIAAFNRVLDYYFDGLFTIEVASGTTLDDEVKDVEIEYTYLWDVLPALYDTYNLVWTLSERNGKYIITAGSTVGTITGHIFKYGYQGGLTRIERQLEDAEIYNQLLGRGGEQNLPYRYFKKEDPNNTAFAGDPDAVEELENVYFERLLDINFRYYVKGWLRNPNRKVSSKYPTPITPESAEIQAHWAYQKGLTDEKFRPVEYVQDEESIAEYGIRQGKLDDDDDIYPTIQGVEATPYGRIDELVAVGEITDGDDGGASEETNLNDMLKTNYFSAGSSLRYCEFESDVFNIPQNRVGEIHYQWYCGPDLTGSSSTSSYAYSASINTENSSIVAIRQSDNAEFPITALPGGYTYKLKIKVALNAYPIDKHTIREVGLKSVKRISSIASSSGNPLTFNVWVKNIWQTTQNEGETNLEYMKRVWEPILGDRVGNEAKLVFSDGWMSASSDYEFMIVDWPVVDRTKSINGVASEWKLTLGKSESEYDSTGKYIPNSTSPKPVAGDHFFFTGIDMPHIYVEWAEKKLNETKQAALDAKSYANPTWAVQLDPIRIHTLEGDETETLMSRLKTGAVMEIYDERFSGGEILQLAIRSMTITWNAGTTMLPSVEVVLSENVLGRSSVSTSLSPETIMANVSSTVAKMQTSMKIAQKSYLSREHEDTAIGKIKLAAGASLGDFASGLTGMGGNLDSDGNAELDSLTLRRWLEVPELRYNRTSIQVGNSWRSPGAGIIKSVYPDYDENGEMLNTGTVHLHLEDGEIGLVALDDICMGIYHDGINEQTNALADTDDGIGNFTFTGFFTTYFRITEILSTDNSVFRYAIRPVSDTWKQTHHPCAQMHFVCYGNFSDKDRQASRYSTRRYERYLKDVASWEFTALNIGAQFGDLANLKLFDIDMTGYSAYLDNIYMSGTIKQFELLPYRMEIDNNGMDALAYGESMTVVCSVYKGFDDVTTKVAKWKIMRDSGDPTEDEAWNNSSKAQNFAGVIVIEHFKNYSDLGQIGVSTLFTITADMTDGNTTNYMLEI
jgi:hypothetical protein